MKVYRIAHWKEHFENNRTRELKQMEWVPVPNRHDGDGYTELLDHPNGMAHYAAWCLLLQIASKCELPADACGKNALPCDKRGTLLRDGAKPHDAGSLARQTRGNRDVFAEAIPRLVSIGWLEIVDIDGVNVAENSAPSCGDTAARCDGVTMEGNGMERKRDIHTASVRRVEFAIPSSEQEAAEWCAPAGVPPNYAKSLYHQLEGRGWVDGAGNKIHIFSSYAKRRYENEKTRATASKQNHREEKQSREFEEHLPKPKRI